MKLTAAAVKTRALRGRLLTPAELGALCAADGVEALGTWLREHAGYRAALAELDTASLRRNLLEQKLSLPLYDEYERIRLHLPDKNTRDFLSAFFMRYDLDFLKSLLCAVFDARGAPATPPEFQARFARRFKVDLARLAKAKTFQDIFDALRGTELRALLSDTYARQATPFALERQLDLYYYLRLWRKLSLLGPEDISGMRRIIGTEIDLLNILWIYRLKHYYRVFDARVYAYLIPVSYKLPVAALNRLAECAEVSDMAGELESTPYASVYLAGPAPFAQPERAMARRLRRICASERHKRPESVAALAGYIFDKEYELANLTAALEGVRYGLPPEEIASRFFA